MHSNFDCQYSADERAEMNPPDEDRGYNDWRDTDRHESSDWGPEHGTPNLFASVPPTSIESARDRIEAARDAFGYYHAFSIRKEHWSHESGTKETGMIQ